MELEDNPEFARVLFGVPAPRKVIIGGKKYDIETAEKVLDLPITAQDLGDLTWEMTSLYRTRGGAFFLSGWGLEETRWACEAGGEIHPGSGILPLTDGQTRILLENYKQADLYEKYFGEVPEAGANTTEPLNIPKLRIDRARFAVSLHGANGTLSKRPFDLLLILAEAGGTVVEGRVIEARLRTQPTDKNFVTDVVRDLREGLRKIDPQGGELIETKTGRGYRIALDASEIVLS